MKLTINLNDPSERHNASMILALWDDQVTPGPPALVDEEEVTYLPDDVPEPSAPPEIVEPEPVVEAPAELPKASVPKVEAPAEKTLPLVSLVDAQTLAKRLVREQGYDKDGIVALFAPAESISALSDHERAVFAAKCNEILGEENV